MLKFMSLNIIGSNHIPHNTLSKLPQEILCPLSTLALLAFAREHFYNLLLAESSTSDPVRGVVATPELSVFIKLLDHPDMLRAAVAQWELKLRGSKRAEKVVRAKVLSISLRLSPCE